MYHIENLRKKLTYHSSNELKDLSLGDIDFSSTTYQVQVLDDKQAFWCFIQIEKQHIKDMFCSCDEQDIPCKHLLWAIYRISDENHLLLHEKFNHSFWRHFTFLWAQKTTFYVRYVEKKISENTYHIKDYEGNTLLKIGGVSEEGKKLLVSIIDKHKSPNEENSIKLSNLSHNELDDWRKGRPTLSLKYELSFWSDLAKWMFFHSDESFISFQVEESFSLPTQIDILFPDINLKLALGSKELSLLLEPLSRENTSLEIIDKRGLESIIAVQYLENEQAFQLYKKKDEDAFNIPKNKIALDDWWYLPKEGFYRYSLDPLLDKELILKEEISIFLHTYKKSLKTWLKDLSLVEDVLRITYHPAFDVFDNLCLNPQFKDFNDILFKESKIFDEWLYIKGKGFYLLKEEDQQLIKRSVIPKNKVGEFISTYRQFLLSYKGFETHVTELQTNYSYKVTDNKELVFQGIVDIEDSCCKIVHFGEWIYLKKYGFYRNKAYKSEGEGVSKERVSEKEVSIFIENHESELENVPNFFSNLLPIKKIFLEMKNDIKGIKINPLYVFYPQYKKEDYYVFGRYIFIKGKGFSRIPPAIRIPERYSRERIISKNSLDTFFLEEFESIKPYLKQLDSKYQDPENIQLIVHFIEKQIDDPRFFSINLSFQTSLGEVNICDVKKFLSQNKQFYPSRGGLLDLHQSHFLWLKKMPSSVFSYQDKTLQINAVTLMKLFLWEGLTSSTENTPASLLVKKLFHNWEKFDCEQNFDISGLKSNLRPYQLNGAKWLWFLYNNGLSGLLCDDMGLGKTHQAMALLASIKAKKRASKSNRTYYLIVCPTSVIYHWQDKLKEFFPEAKVYTFYANHRDLDKFRDKYDILLTSYGILRMEQERIESIHFEMATFDEIQLAKNRSSRVYAAVDQVKSFMKLGLSGTPIENNLKELKSLFDIVLPGYMPEDKVYKDKFVYPIERHQNKKAIEQLKNYIKPFVLRRKKCEVLKELPEKTEELAFCDLLNEQAQLYHQVIEDSQRTIIDPLSDKGKPIDYLHVFSLLSKLKQICNHPALFLKDEKNYTKYLCGKWLLFIEILQQAIESQEKVVVYTHFLGMLDIIENYLQDHHIEYASIQGKTQDRRQQLKKFHEDPNCLVFLGSLGAAGVGIDLTAASVVIHYDRWWNKSKEDQATDRVHRIGQTRGVQVFKLITKKTFEERINKMIEHKGRLLDDIIDVDGKDKLKRFSREELVDLLQDIQIGET